VGRDLFAVNISVPLGVAHRRALIEKVGGFNELHWHEEDADLWRRLARAGAKIVFLPAKSGRYHVRPDSRARQPHLTRKQREVFQANWRAGRPLYDPRGLDDSGQSPRQSDPVAGWIAGPRRQVRKIAFISPHCLVDFTNGAAIATRDGLTALAGQGFECMVFCGTRLDTAEEGSVEESLARQRIAYTVRPTEIGRYQGFMFFTSHGKVPVVIFKNASTRGNWFNVEEANAFLAACDVFLAQNRPDVVWTYGGDPASLAVQRLAKRLDIPVLFALHNFGYVNAEAFKMVDYVAVPSEFSRRYHWEKLGLACQVLPNIVNAQRVESPQREPRYLTFVNPEANKGVYVFARIAAELARRRPDIPLLVVEGRRQARALEQVGVDLSRIKTVPTTHDPRSFYGVTRAVLMPSLWNESFGLVAAEAMLNGIPVLASSRGALPETVGNAGFLFDIPAQYTPETRLVPAAEEVAPWVNTIIRLWDDPAYYEQCSQRARRRAEHWRPENLAPLYGQFFGNVFPQPGPPLVPTSLPVTMESRTPVPARADKATAVPHISVIMPVHNGDATLDRAIESVRSQTFSDWELIVVDDQSTDGSCDILRRWAAADPRIRFIRQETPTGMGAARNAGLRVARGQWVAYLDVNDQYDPGYLEQVRRLGDQVPVLVFAYDIVEANGQVRAWNPEQVRQHLFADPIIAPLGVASPAATRSISRTSATA
jgi:glycosyltransferase involved in cell wall biosynthesis